MTTRGTLNTRRRHIYFFKLIVFDIYDSVWSSFLSYFTTQTEIFARKVCNFVIRNYIQT